jgi:acyl carrier protein
MDPARERFRSKHLAGDDVVSRFLPTALALLIAVTLSPSSAFTQVSTSVVEGVRATLAEVLRTDAAKLPVDTPVTELGADDLSVVEWQMATEKAFRVDIPSEKLFDSQTNTRKDLSISSMAQIVAASKPWPEGKTR